MKIKFKNNSSIGNRIREIREQKGWARPVMAEKLGVSLSALQNWEISQTEPQASMIITIAKTLGVSPNYLLTGETDITANEKPNNVSHQTFNSLPNDSDENFVEIEDCRDVRISAGNGGLNDEYLEFSTTKVEKRWLDSRYLKAKHCAMYLVSGDSMYPTLKDGEEIIVDRSKTDLKDGKIFVLNNEGAMYVKKVQVTPYGIILISQNPEYSPIKLDASEMDNLIVIGQVVRGYRDF